MPSPKQVIKNVAFWEKHGECISLMYTLKKSYWWKGFLTASFLMGLGVITYFTI